MEFFDFVISQFESSQKSEKDDVLLLEWGQVLVFLISKNCQEPMSTTLVLIEK